MEALTLRSRGLLLSLLTGLFSLMLLLSIYYLPATENVVSYFGFRHGSSCGLAHSASPPASTSTYNANDCAAWDAHLAEVAASAKAARPHATGTSHGNANIPPTGPACQLAEGATDILVVVKTSAAEIDAKLPTQLSTVLSCVPNYIIVSDLEQDFHGHHVHDALWHVDQKVEDSEPEFKYRRALKAHGNSGMDLEVPRTTDGEHLGRRLDKRKDVSALHLAYTLWPNVSWYMFVDVDTYLSFPNLLKVVKELDPERPFYTGSKIGSGKTSFAQGGSGYLISRGAARVFDEEVEDGEKERQEDGTLELAMRESGVMFESLPQGKVFQDNPIEMFGGWEGMWCQPAVSWHHVGSVEVERMWEWERHFLETTGDAVIRFKDVFEGLVEPRIRRGHEAGWDNSVAWKVLLPLRANSTDEERRPWEGLEELEVDPTVKWDACEKACQLDQGCLSWQFGPGRCNLGRSVVIGKKMEGEVKEHGLAFSGWNMKRIKRWKERIGPCT